MAEEDDEVTAPEAVAVSDGAEPADELTEEKEAPGSDEAEELTEEDASLASEEVELAEELIA